MKQFLYVLSPTRYQLVIYLLLAVGLLAVGSLAAFIDVLTEGNLNQQAFWDFGGRQVDRFFADQELNNIFGSLSLALWWSSLGALAYTVFWIFANLVIALHNKYVFKTEYVHMPLANHEHRLAHISRQLLRLSVILIGLLYLVAALRLFLPLSLKLMNQALGVWPSLESLASGVGALALAVLALHIPTLLLRTFYLRARA